MSRQVTPEGTVFVLKDPIRSRFYRFREAEHFIAAQLDGETPLETVHQRTEAEFGASLQRETLNAFVGQLEQAGLLKSDKNEPPKIKARRISGSLLALRFKAFDPDRLFNLLLPKVQFFFTPAFLVVSAISILAAVCLAVTGWEEATQNFSRLYQLSAIPLISVMVFLVIGAHEFAHGLTCKRFGGEVHEIGFFLIYFQPAFYCNVSDAWLFPEKSKRLWVGFAGPYFELFLWSIATIVWRLTDVETWLNYVAFIVVTTSGIKTLFNFNPIIKLDGYYLLSDWLEIPNLRKRAFAYVGHGMKKLFIGGGQNEEQLTERERRICLAYGLVASVSSFALLAFALTKLGRYFVEQSQPLAIALFTGLVAIKVRRRFRRLFGKSGGYDPDDLDDPDLPEATQPAQSAEPAQSAKPAQPTESAESPEPAKPAQSAESAEKTKPRKRTRPVLSWRRAVTLTLIVGALFALFCYRELKIGGAFDVLPIHNADVRAQVEGIIEQIYVDEGDTVQEGAMIARLADLDDLAELRKTEAAIAEARARLKLLEAGARAEEIVLAKATVSKAEERVRFAKSRLERDKLLFNQKLLSPKDFEDTQADLADRENEWAEATGKLEVLLAGSRPEQIEATKAQITQLEAQQRYLEEKIRLLKVVSPAAGIVATPSRQLKEMKHQLVKKGDLVAKVFDLKTITAEIVVSEKDIADVKLGQKVVLKARAFPEMTFFGKVTSIATAALVNPSSTPGAQTGAPTPTLSRSAVAAKMILVTTEIDNGSLLLKPEMTGQAKVFCGQRRLFDIITRRIARTIKVQFWSWW